VFLAIFPGTTVVRECPPKVPLVTSEVFKTEFKVLKLFSTLVETGFWVQIKL